MADRPSVRDAIYLVQIIFFSALINSICYFVIQVNTDEEDGEAGFLFSDDSDNHNGDDKDDDDDLLPLDDDLPNLDE